MSSPAHDTGQPGVGTAAIRRRWSRVLSHPLAHLTAAFLVVGLVQGFVVKIFTVPSASMAATLEPGDRVLVNRLAATPEVGDVIVFTADAQLWGRSTATGADAAADALEALQHGVHWVVGDLMGMGPTTGHTLVKRVLGTPGDSVECCDTGGRLLINGQALSEPYISRDVTFEEGTLDCETAPVSLRCFRPIIVPAGMLLVLGDRRAESSDGVSPCRGYAGEAETCARWVRERDVIGEVTVVVWPLGRSGAVH